MKQQITIKSLVITIIRQTYNSFSENILNINLLSAPIKMRPKLISIPSSTTSQQITTPSWAVYTHKNPILYPISKMSRLDELLSRNQQIYQNMRIQLQQISKSNQNIDANINNIKPLYDSQCNDSQTINQQREKKNNNRDSITGNSSRQKNQIYSFNNISQQQSLQKELQRESTHSYSYNIVNNQQHQNFDKHTQSSKSGLVTKKPKKNHSPYTNYQEYKKITHEQTNSSFKQQPCINQPSVLQQKIEQQYKIKQHKNHNTNPYDQLDSSPILSQSHNTNPIYTNSSFYNKVSDRQRQQFYSQDQNIQQNISRKFHTFQEGEKEEQVEHIDTLRQKIQQQQQYYQRNILKDSYKCMVNSNKKSTSTAKNFKKSQIQPTLPPRLSILFIPFNRLYSSPILQQTGPRQLILARKSKTQVVVNISINKIVNGIKYKNVNLINDQITVYSQVINALKKIQSVLRQKRAMDNQQFGNFNKDASFSTEKDSFDVGIVGGKNSLKKKIHYALIAHVYADIIEQINCYFNQSEQISFENLVLAIEHQQQHSGSEPIIMKSQGCLSSSKIENQIVYGNLNALISQIFDTMKAKQNNFTTSLSSTTNLKQQPNFHCIRVTKFILQAIDKKRNVSVTLCNTKIISTNKIQNQFINDLDLDVAIWCVNPLVKNYDNTFHVLECYNQYNSKKINKKQKRQNISNNIISHRRN